MDAVRVHVSIMEIVIPYLGFLLEERMPQPEVVIDTYRFDAGRLQLTSLSLPAGARALWMSSRDPHSKSKNCLGPLRSWLIHRRGRHREVTLKSRWHGHACDRPPLPGRSAHLTLSAAAGVLAGGRRDGLDSTASLTDEDRPGPTLRPDGSESSCQLRVRSRCSW